MTVAIRRSNDVIIKIDSLVPTVTEVIPPHDFDRGEFDKILDGFKGLGRGDAYEQYLRDSVAMYSLAEMFARRVAGKHNKNVIFILFGDLGSGKSMALLKLALSCAMWLAALQKGKVQDYFRFSNIAVIDPEMLQEKLANLIRYNIYILDDAGPGYDARTFMSKSNRDLNYILQTCRTMNNILLISAPHGAMLDVTIHRLAQYYGEVSEVRHDIGISFIKVFRLIRVYREGKIFYVYMQKRNISARRYYTDMPPKALKDKYDIVREEQAAIIAARKAEREAAEKAGGGAAGRPSIFNETHLAILREMVRGDQFAQINDLAASVGTDPVTVRKLLVQAGITPEKVSKRDSRGVMRKRTKWVIAQDKMDKTAKLQQK